MNLRGIDLNLLVILDALLDEGHVTRAAMRLGLSQPATSSALDRCRHLFSDPLLERRAGGMALTARAEALKVPLKRALAAAAQVLDLPEEDLATLRRTIRMIFTDHPAALIAANLHGCLKETAPGLDMVLMPWHGSDDALDKLGRGDVEIIATISPTLGTDFRQIEVSFETYVVAMRADHTAAQHFDLDRWLAYPHIVVSGRGAGPTEMDRLLAQTGRQRRVGMVVPSFLMVPSLLAASDMMALIPRRCLTGVAQAELAVLDPPIPVPGFPLYLATHARNDGDIAVRHVVQEIAAMLRQL
ncbi:LysR substrate-binding domain-containing protein [Lacibacterium aquatile]|uniref:LysR substrate-binding domain-containing protein n=1 Tax=Lacibacterium aquatile TaxID=1168082 RepID=A0ABW5DVZ4_9PROT